MSQQNSSPEQKHHRNWRWVLECRLYQTYEVAFWGCSDEGICFLLKFYGTGKPQ